MADDPTTQIVTPPEVELTELAAASWWPATDRAYQTPSGTKLRIRVVRIAEQATVAPTGDPAAKVSPSGMNLSISLALLNDDMTVALDGSDAYLITNLHELVWSDEAMRNDAFDPAADLAAALRQQAYALETRMTKRKTVTDLLAQSWGGAPLSAPTGAPAATDGALAPQASEDATAPAATAS
jgi:hypothetical protein